MRCFWLAAVAGCVTPGADESSSSSLPDYLANCVTTNHTVPDSCGEAYETPGPYVQVVPVESELVVGLGPDGSWVWLDGLSIEVDPSLRRGPWASLSGGDELLCG